VILLVQCTKRRHTLDLETYHHTEATLVFGCVQFIRKIAIKLKVNLKPLTSLIRTFFLVIID